MSIDTMISVVSVLRHIFDELGDVKNKVLFACQLAPTARFKAEKEINLFLDTVLGPECPRPQWGIPKDPMRCIAGERAF